MTQVRTVVLFGVVTYADVHTCFLVPALQTLVKGLNFKEICRFKLI